MHFSVQSVHNQTLFFNACSKKIYFNECLVELLFFLFLLKFTQQIFHQGNAKLSSHLSQLIHATHSLPTPCVFPYMQHTGLKLKFRLSCLPLLSPLKLSLTSCAHTTPAFHSDDPQVMQHCATLCNEATNYFQDGGISLTLNQVTVPEVVLVEEE